MARDESGTLARLQKHLRAQARRIDVKLARREWLVGSQLFSVGLGQAEDLARVDQVRIADLILVRAIDQGVLEAGTVVCTRNVPEIVTAHDDQAAAVARPWRDGDTVKRQFET